MRKILVAAGALLILAGGAGAAKLATSQTITDTFTVPYTIGDQTGQVVLSHDLIVPVETQTVTETVTQTVTVTQPTTTTPPPPPTDTSPPPAATISPSQFSAMAVAGATVENVTVTGGVDVRNPNVTLRNVTIQGDVEFDVGSSGSKMLGSSANALYIWGADNIVVDGNTFDGHNRTLGGKMWDENGDPPRNIRITNNVFKNQQTGNSADHSQAIFVGYSDGVLIQGNTFINNGSTSDIFFSWWGDLNPSASRTYPRNVCVKGNSFSDPNDLHYFAVNFRSELKTSMNIVVDPSEQGFSTTSPEFNGTC